MNTRSLTGIRGLAILLVIFSHAADLGVRPHPWVDFLGVGRYGVFLFFVLSAFLLTRQYLRAFPAADPGGSAVYFRYTLCYLRRRFWRIFPLYVAALLVYFLLYETGHGIYPVDTSMALKSLFLFDATGIFWTIPVEFEYYFLIPLVALAAIRIRKPAMVIAAFALLIFGWSRLVPPHYEADLSPFLPVFLIGSLAAAVSEMIASGKPPITVPAWLFNIAAGLGLAAFFILFPRYFRWISGLPVGNTMFHDRFLLWGFLSAGLIVATLHGDGWVRGLMEHPALVFWGEISFSAYLGHMVILKSVHHFLPGLSAAAQWWLFAALTAALSWFAYRYLERPAMRWGRARPLFSGASA